MSRSPTPNPFGKCDCDVKTAVPEEIRDELGAMAALSGQTVSEYLRDLICCHLRGEFTMLQLSHSRGRRETPE